MSDQIPFVDLYPQYEELRSEIDAALATAVRTSSFIGGTPVSEFESALAQSVGVRHACGVSSATAALWMTLKALGVGPGDEVITTPLTAFPTVEAVLLNGARVVFADIEPDTFQISAAAIEARITSRTKAILPVHLYGIPVNLPRILEIAGKHGIPVVEDCAQAQGAEINGRRVGSMGVAGCFSFFPSKNLGAWGDGGAVASDNEELVRFVRMFSNHGRLEKYTHEICGANERLDALHAAILRVKLTKLDEWNARRRQIATIYEQELADVPEVVLPQTYPNTVPVWHLYVIRAKDRDNLAKHLKGRNIGTGLHYPLPMHLQPAMGGREREGECPIAETACKEILSLPMYPHLKAEQVVEVARAIREFYGRRP
ncbi:MAG: DegT/DnrJ/EryC1/StrS family aminotransferase [Candidatus Hydrogenedentota bacterium]|nr:MAG: DegT/DnrJ/EryC1/StrS family aminotransferase [Candidatus Hydrogenedentota bacterium]